MQIQAPRLDAELITRWISEAAVKSAPANSRRTSAARVSAHTGFDFKKARQALQRARAKTSKKGIKPLRRLRTNQAAVNESLMDALSALVALNKQMAAELAALSSEVAELRVQLAERAEH